MEQTAYRQYVTNLNQLHKKMQQGQIPKVLMLYGDCTYLIEKSFSFLKEFAIKQFNFSPITLDPERVDIDKYEEIFLQKGLFEEKTLYVMRGFEKKSVWTKLIAREHEKFSNSLVVIVHDEAKLPADFAKLSSKESIALLACSAPQKNELPKFVSSMGERYGLKLTSEVVQVLSQIFADQLFEIENIFKIARSALVESNQSNILIDLNMETIFEIIGMIPDDRVFELFKYLRARQYSNANAFIYNLLSNGESPLAILGMLTKFLRDEVQNPRGQISKTKLADIILRCSQIDTDLKSSKRNEFNLLSDVMASI